MARFKELSEAGNSIRRSGYTQTSEGMFRFTQDLVNAELAHHWAIGSLSLLERVFGRESTPYRKLDQLYDGIHVLGTFENALGIFDAAFEEYKNGHLFNTRALLQAEVFDDFLEQAEHLLKHNYVGPAAVLAGAVLEDGLRTLCKNKFLPLPERATIEPMNTALAKAGVYNLLVQKRITALADLTQQGGSRPLD